MKLPRRALATLVVGAATLLGSIGTHPRVVLEVDAAADLQAILDRAPSGAMIVVGPGVRWGPLLLDRPLDLVGRPGAEIVAARSADAAVTVTAGGVVLRGFTIRGASSGIVVREANDVTLSHITIEDAALHGIEVIDASAHIDSVAVTDLQDPLAQGIEVRNADGRPATAVSHSRIDGGQEGIVSHVSDVVIFDNVVTATTMRAIAVTEMSHGLVRGNAVTRARGAGLFCGDMSRCAFEHNVVVDVAAISGGYSTAGWGLVSSYHSTASSQGDRLSGASGETTALMGARIIGRSALEGGAGWGTIVPGGAAILVAALLLALATGVVWLMRGRGPRLALPAATRRNAVLLLVIGGVLVQSFHMGEHVIQVLRVHSDGVPSRGGLVGSIADTEWVHFTYNAMVLLLLGALFTLRPGASRVATLAGNVVAAGFLIQSWHVVEHTAKVIQHVVTGAKVNPGVVGGNFDLVWFHFTINLAVYAAAVISGVLYLKLQRASTRAPVRSGYAVGA